VLAVGVPTKCLRISRDTSRRAGRNAIGAVLGSAGLVVFAMIGEAAFGHLPPFTVLLLALVGWAVTSLLLYAGARLHPARKL
jgi:hypothetical protein